MARYFLFADVLGFTNFVNNISHNSLDERLEEWISVIDLIRQGSDVLKVSTVSDSVLAMEEDTEGGLDRLTTFSRLLLERSIRTSFPIRGAITKGDLTWEETIYGKAFIRAAELEKSQDWIGISCQPNLDIDWSWESACCYPIPRKTGLVGLAPAIIWNIPEPKELFRLCFGRDEEQKHQFVEWDVYSKFRNTLLFRSYVRSARGRVSDPKIFDGEVGSF